MGQAAGSGEPDARPGVDVVFFDIDDTLYDQAKPFAYAVRRVCGDLPGATDAALYDASRRHSGPIFAAFSARHAPTTEEYALRMQQTLADFGVSIDHKTAVEAQRVYADESGVAMSLSPAMASCLDACRSRARLGVGVISNGRKELQAEKLGILGIAPWAWQSPTRRSLTTHATTLAQRPVAASMLVMPGTRTSWVHVRRGCRAYGSTVVGACGRRTQGGSPQLGRLGARRSSVR